MCYELNQNLNANNYTVAALNNLTLKSEDIFEKIVILDAEYTFNNTNKNSPVEIETFYLDNKKCFGLATKNEISGFKKDYFTLNEPIKIHINLEEMPIKRYLLFINDKESLDLEWRRYYYLNRYYLCFLTEQQHVYQDDYFYFKNFFSFIKTSLGIEEKKNDQISYSNHLKKDFNHNQLAATTSVPLYPNDEDLPIKNHQFQNFMLFRSLEADKNEYDFTANLKRYNFFSHCYSDQTYHLSKRSIISFIPFYIHSETVENNKYHLIEVLLHKLILVSFWYKISLIHLPKSLKKAYPTAKFFVVCFLYIIVLSLCCLFECLFRFIRFLSFRQV